MREKVFYDLLLEMIEVGKTSWGKNELKEAIKDLYIVYLSDLCGKAR